MKKCVNCGRKNTSKGVLCRSCVKALDSLPSDFKKGILESAKQFGSIEKTLGQVPDSDVPISEFLKVVNVANVKIRRDNP